MHTIKLALAALAATVLFAAPAAAQGTFAGTWVIRQRVILGPWVPDGPISPTDSTERRLVGGRVTFLADRVRAPPPLACRGPHYQMRNYSADMLFQGSLTDAENQATALGFTTRPIKTLETGCAGAIDFHMLDDNTMQFALNNRIYTLDRVRPYPEH